MQIIAKMRAGVVQELHRNCRLYTDAWNPCSIPLHTPVGPLRYIGVHMRVHGF